MLRKESSVFVDAENPPGKSPFYTTLKSCCHSFSGAPGIVYFFLPPPVIGNVYGGSGRSNKPRSQQGRERAGT